MRKLSLAMMGIATAALMTMVSCRKPVNGLVTPGEARTVTFTATTESNDGSKTAVEDHDILWKEGDEISVNGEKMTLASGDGKTSGTFVGDISATASYYIGYPLATTKYTASPLAFSVGIPESWTYDANNVVVPMAAYTTKEGNIQFYNAVNVLKLNLKGNDDDASKLTSIELSHPSVNLNGDITVKFDGKGKPTFEAASNGTTTTTVNFSGGLQLTSATTSIIYIVLPKIGDSKVSNNITVTFNCANGKYMEKTITVTEDFNTVNHLIHNDENVLIVNATTAPTFLPGDFSVSTTDKVKFSKGNLQFQTTQKTWRFAENQWDMCDKNEEEHTTSDYADNTDKWIDLFGWGTSGYNSKHPYMTSANDSDYGDGDKDIAGTNYDWGVYNAISNGGNAAGMWRTLTSDEWGYLLTTREVTVSGEQKASCGEGYVNNVYGLIILPDNWDGSVCSEFTYGPSNWSNTFNESTNPKWSAMESAGAVFLPAAGARYRYTNFWGPYFSVSYVNSYGNYWSSSYKDALNALYLGFGEEFIMADEDCSYNRCSGYSVRLVKDVTGK